jgi:hypothetical protein
LSQSAHLKNKCADGYDKSSLIDNAVKLINQIKPIKSQLSNIKTDHTSTILTFVINELGIKITFDQSIKGYSKIH